MVSHKNYFLTLMGVAAAGIVVLVLAEWVARAVPSPYMTKFAAIQQRDVAAKTLILGNSHLYFGLNPEFFSEPALNLANVSQDFKYDFYILKIALEKIRGVQFVIVPISTSSLYNNLETGKDFWRKYNYRIYMGYQDYPLAEWFEPASHSVIISSQNKLGLLQRTRFFLSGSSAFRDWTEDGWGMAYRDTATESKLAASGIQAAARHQRSNTLDDVAISNLKGLAELCRSKGIKLLVVTPPAFDSYRQLIDGARLETMASVGAELSAGGSDVKYVSYFSDAHFGPEDYYDADHLNHQGAEKFSRIIDEAIEHW